VGLQVFHHLLLMLIVGTYRIEPRRTEGVHSDTRFRLIVDADLFATLVVDDRYTSITSLTIALCCKGWQMLLMNLQLLMLAVMVSKVTEANSALWLCLKC
jgi:hypothetical protein